MAKKRGGPARPDPVAEPAPPAAPADPAPPSAETSSSRPVPATIVPGGGEPPPVRGRRRWPAVVAVVAALAVVGLVLAIVLPRTGGDDDAAGPGDGAAADPQDTTLVLVQGSDGALVGGELLASDGDSTSGLLVPGDLLVDVAGRGRVPFSDSLLTGVGAPGQALGDLVGVRVDGSVVVPATAVASLVDADGGLTVDLDVAVDLPDGRLRPGPDQLLDGAAVVAWLDVRDPGEAPEARLARLGTVVAGLLAGLPGSGDVLDADGVQGDLSADDLAERLRAAQADAEADRFGAFVLPTEQGAAVEDLVALRLDRDGTTELLETRFAGALLGDTAGARVLVQNGFGTPGLGEQARERLVDAGFRYVSGGNASALGQDTTLVLLPEDTPEQRELGESVAAALGLPPDVLAVGQDDLSLADVVVVLGGDFADVAASPTP